MKLSLFQVLEPNLEVQDVSGQHFLQKQCTGIEGKGGFGKDYYRVLSTQMYGGRQDNTNQKIGNQGGRSRAGKNVKNGKVLERKLRYRLISLKWRQKKKKKKMVKDKIRNSTYVKGSLGIQFFLRSLNLFSFLMKISYVDQGI